MSESAFGVDHGDISKAKTIERRQQDAKRHRNTALGSAAMGAAAVGGGALALKTGGIKSVRALGADAPINVAFKGVKRSDNYKAAGAGAAVPVAMAAPVVAAPAVGQNLYQHARIGSAKRSAKRQAKKAAVVKFVGAGAYPYKEAAKMYANNPLIQGHAAALGGATAIQHRKLDEKRTPKQKKRADMVSGGAVGAASAQAAYGMAGYAGKAHQRIKSDKKVYNDPVSHRAVKDAKGKVVLPAYKTPELKKIVEGHKKEYGFKSPDRKNQDTKGFTRNYPKELPGSKTVRVLGRTHHGKTGLAIGGAVAAAGAAVGARRSGKKFDRNEKRFSKSFNPVVQIPT